MRTDVDGTQLNEGNIVENWEGRRAILDADLNAKDENGELKTPIKLVAEEQGDGVADGNGVIAKPLISLEKQLKPNWHPLNRWLEQR